MHKFILHQKKENSTCVFGENGVLDCSLCLCVCVFVCLCVFCLFVLCVCVFVSSFRAFSFSSFRFLGVFSCFCLHVFCFVLWLFGVVVVVVVRSVVRQVSELHRCSVCARDTKPYSRDSANTLSFFLDQSRSHLQSCEHSWAEQTTGL